MYSVSVSWVILCKYWVGHVFSHFLLRLHVRCLFLVQDHEVHRQWVALVDDENPKDSGTQGYLQLSIAIVGPGDKLKVTCLGLLLALVI